LCHVFVLSSSYLISHLLNGISANTEIIDFSATADEPLSQRLGQFKFLRPALSLTDSSYLSYLTTRKFNSSMEYDFYPQPNAKVKTGWRIVNLGKFEQSFVFVEQRIVNDEEDLSSTHAILFSSSLSLSSLVAPMASCSSSSPLSSSSASLPPATLPTQLYVHHCRNIGLSLLVIS
jgi:hypothetical protein